MNLKESRKSYITNPLCVQHQIVQDPHDISNQTVNNYIIKWSPMIYPGIGERVLKGKFGASFFHRKSVACGHIHRWSALIFS